MSNLPDLDTANVGFAAYWNAIDQGGVSDIAPDEVLSNANIVSYTLYDNGVEGRYTTSTGREISFRVKGDGWIVTYMDRTNDFSKSSGSPVRGYWDVVRDLNSVSGGSVITPQISPTVIEEELNTLRQELSNSDSMNFAYTDVGVYNYEYSGATTLTVLGYSTDLSDGTSTPGFSYTSATTLEYAAAYGGASSKYSSVAASSFEGVTLCSISSESRNDEYGAVDALSQGLIPNSGTEYNHTLTSNGAQPSSGTVVVLWS